MYTYIISPIPEIYCDITVAIAAPRMPCFNTKTKYKSKPILSITDTHKNTSGITELPIPRRRLEK